MTRLDAFRAMTPVDVMEAIAEDPSLLAGWQEEIAKRDIEFLEGSGMVEGLEGEVVRLRRDLAQAVEKLEAIRSAFISHLDGRNYLDELNPAGWHHADIVVRIGGKDRHFEGDWLKNVWYALRRSEGFVPPAASMSGPMSDQAKNYAVDSAAEPKGDEP